MPGMAFEDRPVSPSLERVASLKAHRNFPRNRPTNTNVNIATTPRSRSFNGDFTTTTGVQTQQSEEDIQETVSHSFRRQPGNIRPQYESHLSSPQDTINGIDESPSLLVAKNRRHKTAINTPPPGPRYPSSRAESFETAREEPASDAEDTAQSVTPRLADLIEHERRKEERQKSKTNKPQSNVGLGLSLDIGHITELSSIESPEKGARDLGSTPPDRWTGAVKIVSNDPNAIDTPAAVQAINPRDVQFGYLEETPKSFQKLHTAQHDFQSSLEQFAYRRLATKSGNSHSSTSTEKSARRFPRSNNYDADDSDLDVKLQEVDNRRLSAMSAGSTIIEALVFESPSPKTRRLRHTSKVESLRAVSSPETNSNRSSLLSSESKPRPLHHIHTRIPDRGNRKSMNSDSGIDMGSDLSKRWDVIPNEDVPQRRSSLKSKAREHRLQEYGSHGAKGQFARTTAAPPASILKKDDQKTGRGRPAPARLALAPREERKHAIPPLKVPRRTSSLSAPTSRNASRTTSLTSTSVHGLDSQPRITQSQQTPSTPRVRLSEKAPPSAGDKSTEHLSLHRKSALLTPFSATATSIGPSTPGPVEVSEATAISIYPHSNDSILIVQQIGVRRGPNEQQQSVVKSTIVPSANISLPWHQPDPNKPSSQLLDGLLQNPRAPPPPPAQMCDQSANAALLQRQDSRGRRALSRLPLVRRAMSARRYSDTLIQPNINGSYREKASTFREHPRIRPGSKAFAAFWRPRGFWNDLSDDENGSPEDNDSRKSLRRSLTRGRRNDYQEYSSDTSTGHRSRRLSIGPSALVRGFGSIRDKRRTQSVDVPSRAAYKSHLPSRQPSIRAPNSLRVSAANSQSLDTPTLPIVRFDDIISVPQDDGRATEREKRHIAAQDEMRYIRIPFISTLRDRVDERRLRREEERREYQRDKLRQSIGPVLLKKGDKMMKSEEDFGI